MEAELGSDKNGQEEKEGREGNGKRLRAHLTFFVSLHFLGLFLSSPQLDRSSYTTEQLKVKTLQCSELLLAPLLKLNQVRNISSF